MSIQAMTWALSLPIPPSAKLTLVAIGNYADERGWCYPAIPTLARDTSQSDSSVQRRLKELEALGAFTRFARYEENGRRTSDQIRLNLALRPEDVAARQDDNSRDDAGEHDESAPDEGDNQAAGDGVNLTPGTVADCDRDGRTADTGMVALVRPASEPSLEPDSPQSPPLAEHDPPDANEPAEAEGFADLLASHPGAAFADRHRAAQLFNAFTPSERIHARAAARLYAADVTKFKRKPKNLDRWLRERAFEVYPDATLPKAPVPAVFHDDRQTLLALQVKHWICTQPRPGAEHNAELRLARHDDGRRGVWLRSELSPDVAALAVLSIIPPAAWKMVAEGQPEFAAWRARIHEWTGTWVEAHRIWTEPYDAEIHDMRRIKQPGWRMRKSVTGLRVPCPWPPRKDGTLSHAPPSPPPIPPLTDDDVAALNDEFST